MTAIPASSLPDHPVSRSELNGNVRLPASLRSPPQAECPKRLNVDADLARFIPKLYRVLDLINEQGSGGLVDKVIIAQDGLKRFINDICPGAYATLTKVDFKALDTLSVRPVGVYGDRREIARFLLSMSVMDDSTAQLLLCSKDNSSQPTPRSGIYLIRSSSPSEILYAVYWPQEATWMDHAADGPRRNRITFMRYLSKLCDQLICFVSAIQSRAFVWQEDVEEDDDFDNVASSPEYCSDDDDDRFRDFVITKTNEQDESVIPRPGFLVYSALMKHDEPASGDEDKTHIPPLPQLIYGETSQAFLSCSIIPPSIEEGSVEEEFTQVRLRDLLMSSTVFLESSLPSNSIQILVENGLSSGAYQNLCKDWKERKDRLSKEMKKYREEEKSQMDQALLAVEPAIRKQLMGSFIEMVLGEYPCLDVTRLSGSHSINPSDLDGLRADFRAFIAAEAPDILSLPAFRHLRQKITELPSPFRKQKERVMCAIVVTQKYPEYANEKTIKSIIKDGYLFHLEGIVAPPTSWTGDSPFHSEAVDTCNRLSDCDFLNQVV